MTDRDDDEGTVLATNRRFYEAFEARDLDAMSSLWEHSDRCSCTHPGWARLRGWASVSASYFALFSNEQRLQFILTDEQVVVDGELAWVTLDENILGLESGGTVATVNLFARTGEPGRWLMVGHHGGIVSSSLPDA